MKPSRWWIDRNDAPDNQYRYSLRDTAPWLYNLSRRYYRNLVLWYIGEARRWRREAREAEARWECLEALEQQVRKLEGW